MLKKVLMIAALAALVSTAKDDSFAGKWVLDKQASTASADIPDNLRQEFKKKGTGYTVETVWREPRSGIAPLVLLGIMTTNLQISLDGTETENLIGPFRQVSKTTVNGNQMVTEWTAVANREQVKGHWTRTLSDDGKQMTLEIEESTSDGKSGNGKLVFKRK